MQRLTSSSLFQTLTSLTESAEQVGVQLTKAAKRLHEAGEIPSEELLELITKFRQDFLVLRDQGLTTAKSLATPAFPVAETPISLYDLKTLIQSIVQEE